MRNQKGNVNIILVLLITLIGASVLGSYALISLQNLQTTQKVIKKEQARYAAEACIEQSIFEILSSRNFSNGSIELENAECEYQTSGNTIESTGQSGSSSVRIRVVLDSNYEVSTWQEF